MRQSILLQLVTLCLVSITWLLTSCSGFADRQTSVVEPRVTVSTSAIPAALLTQAQTLLHQETGIPQEQMQLQASEAVEWSDACLGVVQPDRLCAQVITPGYRLVMTTPQGEYVVHSDRTGNAMQIAQSP
ncbi:MAG: hypothetical protein HC881_04740 [Leptolyngbyaceae cyanobacterium SL_7_1]|nr:hypothetical protein [Leptolyngbyaceae cyanobacterium SL_7_1]